MIDRYLRSIYLRLAGAIVVVVALALAAMAALSHRAFERALAPEMATKAAVVGATIGSLLLKAHENHIEFQDIYGIEDVFDEVRKTIPEIASFALTDVDGRIVHQRLTLPDGAPDYFRRPQVLAALRDADHVPPSILVGNQYVVSLPIVSAEGPLGMLHLGVSASFVDAIVMEMAFDVLVILVVALFFALELLNFMSGARLESDLRALGDTFERGAAGRFATPPRRREQRAFSSLLGVMDGVLERVNQAYARLTRDVAAEHRLPAHERNSALASVQSGVERLSRGMRFGTDGASARDEESEIGRVRAPLFLFILAEELTRPFLPGYVKHLLVPIPGLSPQLVLGLPIALFMLIVAVAQPWLGVFCARHGTRRTMLLGATTAAVGFLASAFASSVLDLLLWRSLCAVGYAMVFVAGQAYVLEHAGTTSRARSFSTFVGAIMVAGICGPSIGGILADNVGERATLGVAALLAFGSIAAIRMLPGPARVAPEDARVPRLSEIAALLGNARFMVVTGLAAVPAKVLLTGVCFYLVPLYVLSIEGTQAMAGRILMTYAVLMVVVSPLTAAWATTRERMEWLVGGGLVVSGIGATLLLVGGGAAWVFAAVALIGLGQAMSISAQSALVSEHCSLEIRAIGEGAVYGVYRLLERLGNAAGPLLAGGLVLLIGYRHAFVAIGSGVLLCGVLFLVFTAIVRRPQAVPA